jgi:hypothetical protein
MLQAQAHFKKIVFKKKEHRMAMEAAIRKVMLTGMAIWLRAVLNAVPPVDGHTGFPVYTGMAKGSLEALANYLNARASEGDGRGVAFGISPRVTHITGMNPAAGAAKSKKSNFLIEYRNQYGTFYYKFDWWTNVEHFIQNDSTAAPTGVNLIRPTPWNTMLAGRVALEDYLRTRAPKLPRISDYLLWVD